MLLFKSGFESDVVMPGPKTKHKPERDMIGIHPATQRLAFVFAASDCEETLNIQRHLLKNKGQLDVYGRLVDGHIYVLKKWVINYLQRVCTLMEIFRESFVKLCLFAEGKHFYL